MTTALGAGPQYYDQDVGFAPRPDTILGESGNDTILSSTLGGSNIQGEADNDILQSRGPGDTVFGGTGNDSLRSQQLRTILLGNEGRDTLSADLTASLYGGQDNDFLVGQSANNYQFGNKQADTLLGGIQGGDFLYGGSGADLIGFVGTNGQSNLAGVAVTGAVGGLNQGNNYVSGDLGRDSIVGVNTGDTLDGGEDNDSLTTVGSLSVADGGSGNDSLQVQNPIATLQFSTSPAVVGLSQITLRGGGGDDSLYGGIGRFGEGQNYMDGGDGNDTIRSYALQDALYGGDGNDLITTATTDVLTTQGSSTQPGFAGESTLYGGGGNDTLIAAFSTDYLYGDAGNDSLTGKFTLLDGGDGNDTLNGGNWTLPGGGGKAPAVTLLGGSGSDYISGAFGAVANIYDGGLGDDTIIFTTANDSLLGEGSSEGNDQISFVAGLSLGATTTSFVLVDTLGNNTISGSDGNDSIVTGSGADFLQGGSVAATAGLDVGFGDDTIISGGGNDYLFGGSGQDVLFGEADNDTLQGSSNQDTLVGGAGADVFLYQFKSELNGTLADLITDFNPSEEDKLYFSRGEGGFAFDLAAGFPSTELSPEQFIVLNTGSYKGDSTNNQAGTDVGPVLVYEKASGALWYDSDGGGQASADLVAFMKQPDNTIPSLTRTDVVIIV